MGEYKRKRKIVKRSTRIGRDARVAGGPKARIETSFSDGFSPRRRGCIRSSAKAVKCKKVKRGWTEPTLCHGEEMVRNLGTGLSRITAQEETGKSQASRKVQTG